MVTSFRNSHLGRLNCASLSRGSKLRSRFHRLPGRRRHHPPAQV